MIVLIIEWSLHDRMPFFLSFCDMIELDILYWLLLTVIPIKCCSILSIAVC